MKIVICTINPLFPDKVIGGSTKHLRRVAEHLAELGHQVVVLCTRRSDSADSFLFHPNVVVRPAFVFKQPFPLPYDIPAFQMALNIQHIIDEIADADRLFLYDGELLFPALCRVIPSILSLRDCVYPETMLGTFLFEADGLIALSEYCKASIVATAGQYLEDLSDRVTVIPNGFDWGFFKPTRPSEELLRIVRVDPERDAIILHPHRPEKTKGLRQTVETVHLLVEKYGHHNLKVLVPRWFDAQETPGVESYLNTIQREINSRGLDDVFVFHDWLPQRLMPEYFSLGRLTLVLGSFVEAFGNSAYESLGCGTPAIVSRVSSNRDLVPDQLLSKVHFDDNGQAAKLATEILHRHDRTDPNTMGYLKSQFSVEAQCQAYARVILGARKRPSMRHRFLRTNQLTRYALAPWCYFWDENVYHDFLAEHVHSPELAAVVHSYPNGATISEMLGMGVRKEVVDRWQAEGYLTPQRVAST